jgi:hypothetical protein
MFLSGHPELPGACDMSLELICEKTSPSRFVAAAETLHRRAQLLQALARGPDLGLRRWRDLRPAHRLLADGVRGRDPSTEARVKPQDSGRLSARPQSAWRRAHQFAGDGLPLAGTALTPDQTRKAPSSAEIAAETVKISDNMTA